MKQSQYEELSRITAALSSPVRLMLVDALAQRPHAVEELASAIDQSVANTSRHLQILKRSRLVLAARSGRSITYALAPGVAALFAALRRLGVLRLSTLSRSTPTISRPELLAGLAGGTLQLIDVRPMAEYSAGHLPQARSLPLGLLPELLPSLDASREVIATCRGPWCVFAEQAVALLRQRGFSARCYEDGVSEWLLDGGALEVA
jgi:rhodanese-related sulfurtransferase/DNA-binding transcriptional ArsR family regulator